MRLILQQPQSCLLVDRRSEERQIGVFDEWLDGENGRHLEEYCTEKFACSVPIFIQIYFDELETTNPLGSKTGIHKLGAFYFVLKIFLLM